MSSPLELLEGSLVCPRYKKVSSSTKPSALEIVAVAVLFLNVKEIFPRESPLGNPSDPTDAYISISIGSATDPVTSELE